MLLAACKLLLSFLSEVGTSFFDAPTAIARIIIMSIAITVNPMEMAAAIRDFVVDDFKRNY